MTIMYFQTDGESSSYSPADDFLEPLPLSMGKKTSTMQKSPSHVSSRASRVSSTNLPVGDAVNTSNNNNDNNNNNNNNKDDGKFSPNKNNNSSYEIVVANKDKLVTYWNHKLSLKMEREIDFSSMLMAASSNVVNNLVWIKDSGSLKNEDTVMMYIDRNKEFIIAYLNDQMSKVVDEAVYLENLLEPHEMHCILLLVMGVVKGRLTSVG